MRDDLAEASGRAPVEQFERIKAGPAIEVGR
jgi:hypothetical protein